MNQQVYEFTLVLSGVNDQTEGLEDRLYEAGCDDALINFREGAVYLDFDREADSLEQAVITAIKNIEQTALGAKVIRVEPEPYVSESDIAERLEVSRQTVSLWIKGQRRGQRTPFPHPIMKLESKSPLWRWLSVIQWAYDNDLVDDASLIDQASFMENINAALEERDQTIQASRQALVNQLAA